MAIIVNNATAQDSGTGVTTGNSGGGGDTAFDLVVTSGGSTVVFDNTHAATDTKAYKFTCVSAQNTELRWNIDTQQVSFRAYVWLPAAPSASHRHVDLRTASASALRIVCDTSYRLALHNSAGTSVFNSPALTAGWYRFEASLAMGGTATTATVQFKVFAGHSPTPLTSGSYSSSAFNAGSVANLRYLGFGKPNDTVATAPTFWLDSLAYDPATAVLLGPAPIAITAADAGAGTDTLTPTVELTTGYTGGYVIGGYGVPTIAPEPADGGNASDTLTVASQVSNADSAAGIESTLVVAVGTVSDVAAAGAAVTVAADADVADTATAGQQLAVSAGASNGEVGIAADALRVTVTGAVEDATVPVSIISAGVTIPLLTGVVITSTGTPATIVTTITISAAGLPVAVTPADSGIAEDRLAVHVIARGFPHGRALATAVASKQTAATAARAGRTSAVPVGSGTVLAAAVRSRRTSATAL